MEGYFSDVIPDRWRNSGFVWLGMDRGGLSCYR